MTREERFMLRALELAELGTGRVSPNPMVGCVIVKEETIIGEGWHQIYGGPHAEVNAVRSVKDLSSLAGAELFVTLEPCAHFGKTPPCADLVIQHPFRKVWICNEDPNPLVNGKGIEKIKAAGIPVETRILSQEGRNLNKRFFTFTEKERPFVILKWAETSDGFIATKNYHSKWISNKFSRRLVHKWRSEESAVLVGKNTALYDNPQLTVRAWTGNNPTRIVLDNSLTLPSSLYLFDQTVPTIVFNGIKNEILQNLEYIRIDFQHNFIAEFLEVLQRKKIQSILVEGGAALLQSIIETGLWDEARVFRGDAKFGDGIRAPLLHGETIFRERIGSDELSILKNNF